MFNLSSSMNLPVNEKKKESLILFHQTETFRELIEEVSRFEGITEPVVFKYSDELISKHAQEFSGDIVMIELNESDDITKDAERISHYLPYNVSVIVVGSHNSISTIRDLNSMGYYYLFWPVTKLEVVDFIRGVNSDITKNNQISKSRNAKKIAVLGAKGGIGTSMITAELSKELSETRNSSCVVIDHNFSGGSLDIMLGIKQFIRKKLAHGTLVSNLDSEHAKSMTTEVNNMLSLLSVGSENLSINECKEYIHVLTKELVKQTNFVIEDFSGTTSDKIDFLTKETDIDIIVFVIDQTVFSLREASLIFNFIKDQKLSMRFIIVVNHTKPEKYVEVELKDIPQHVHKSVDVIFPFEPHINNVLLSGDNLYSKNMAISKSINNITALILGESFKELSLLGRIRQMLSL